jgi:hypothetical protein
MTTSQPLLHNKESPDAASHSGFFLTFCMSFRLTRAGASGSLKNLKWGV